MLIDELKHEHRVLVDTLNKVRDLGIGTKEGKELLFKAKNALLGHLKKEDEFLYPKLREKSQANSSLKEIIDTFIQDMEGISGQVMNFFNKYSENSDSLEFARDFGLITALLLKRIRREEAILYEAYLKHCA